MTPALREYITALEDSAAAKAEIYDPWLVELGDNHLVDIGTGPGGVAARLAKLRPGWQVVGIDRDPEMIQYAQSRHCENSNLRFIQRDACSDHGRLATAVILSSVLHEVFSDGGVAAVTQTLRVAKNALAPSGRLILRDFVLPENPRHRVILQHQQSDLLPGRSFSDLAARKNFPVFLGKTQVHASNLTYETDLAGAYEFMYRKDHRATWDAELRHCYGFWTEHQARELVQAAGLHILHLARIPCRWMLEHRLNGRMALLDASSGNTIDLPAHKLLVVAEKP